MLDCHTHLSSASFDHDRLAVLQAAARVGVREIVVVGEDAADNLSVMQLCRHYDQTSTVRAAHDGEAAGRDAQSTAEDVPRLRCFYGLHPDRFSDAACPADDAAVSAVLEQIRGAAGELDGIGEVGLDYWRAREDGPRGRQREVLSALIQLACQLDLPVNIHSRSAGHHTIDLLLELGARRVLMHAFDGKATHARRAAEAGFLFSVPPSIMRSPQKQKLVRALPLEQLALETDSPVLAAEVGERNEPARLTLVVAEIARIKQLSPAEVVAQTSANARRWLR